MLFDGEEWRCVRVFWGPGVWFLLIYTSYGVLFRVLLCEIEECVDVGVLEAGAFWCSCGEGV